jgi:hypothetical protein
VVNVVHVGIIKLRMLATMFIKSFNLVFPSPHKRAFLLSIPDYFTQVFYIVVTMS